MNVNPWRCANSEMGDYPPPPQQQATAGSAYPIEAGDRNIPSPKLVQTVDR